MISKRSSVFAAVMSVTALLVSGCATTIDPCSRAGIEQTVSRTLDEFARDNRADLTEVRRAVAFLDGQSVLGAMRLAQGVDSLRRVATNFENDVVPELQSISQQCGNVGDMRDLFIDFLRDEGFSERVLQWVEDFNFVFEA